jgi:acylphosphatase
VSPEPPERDPSGRVVRRRIVVRGRVHGVGYRVSCARRAEAAGLGGWVRNRPDGTVEVDVEGPAAAVDGFQAWCGQGPPAARVTAVDVTDEDPAGRSEFSIR